MPWTRVAGTGVLAIAGALAGRYTAQRSRIERSWPTQVAPRLAQIGEVDQVSILPLVERLVPEESPGQSGQDGEDGQPVQGGRLHGEPGVAYLINAGNSTVLFDVGFNPRSQAQSALAGNADSLGARLDSIDAVVISHVHADHVGGLGNQRRRTFSFAAAPLEPRGVPAYVPVEMSHDRAEVLPTTAPRVIAPGMALLPPLPRMLFWLGLVAEQALVINVRGFGLVLVTGCGHPAVERMLAVTEMVLDVPVRGVVGGLHLPVHPLGTPLVPQAVLGSPNWPWRPIGEHDVATAIQEITSRGPRLVAVSSHDSTPWTYNAFARAFGEKYRTLRVGDRLQIGAFPPEPAAAADLPA
ncbi:MAG: MBL fold metallo-hydrolase [Actinobacteria bacterium]|nr:MBL fold metallo-hydrolase [Actinomycetota bacterium]